MYVFFETSMLDAQRTFFESVLQLPLIEIEPHLPHHRHGVVKYDAGGVVISLNLTGPSRFAKTTSDALTTVFAEAPGTSSVADRLSDAKNLGVVRREAGVTRFTDRNGHHYRFLASAERMETRGSSPVVERIHLCVKDLESAIEFYADRLGLQLTGRDDGRAIFATGSVNLELEERTTAVMVERRARRRRSSSFTRAISERLRRR